MRIIDPIFAVIREAPLFSALVGGNHKFRMEKVGVKTLYTVSQKMRHPIVTVIVSNLNGFSKFFNGGN